MKRGGRRRCCRHQTTRQRKGPDLSEKGVPERELGGDDALEPRLVLQLTPRGLTSSELCEETPGMEGW